MLNLFPELKLRSRELLLQAHIMKEHPSVSTYQMVLMLRHSQSIPHSAQLVRNQIRINLDVNHAKKAFLIHQREVIANSAQSLHFLTAKPVKSTTKLYLKMGHSTCTTLQILTRYAQRALISVMVRSSVQSKIKLKTLINRIWFSTSQIKKLWKQTGMISTFRRCLTRSILKSHMFIYSIISRMLQWDSCRSFWTSNLR
jgi:hypothetical protein